MLHHHFRNGVIVDIGQLLVDKLVAKNLLGMVAVLPHLILLVARQMGACLLQVWQQPLPSAFGLLHN